MVNKNKQIRFGIIWKDTPHDLFSLFVMKDDSIGLITYLKSSKMGGIITGIEAKSRTQFDINLKEIPMHEFATHKMSFHPSGYIHETDKQDIRVCEFDGKTGLSFEEIIDCAFLFTLYSMTPENYRKHSDSTKSVNLVDVKQFGFVPYQITCYLSKAEYDFEQQIERINATYEGPRSLFLRYKNYLAAYSLDLFIRFHKSSSPFFPTKQMVAYLCKPLPK